MDGFLSKLARRKPSRLAIDNNQKSHFPEFDPVDPRIIYRLSDRARRISLRMNNADRQVIVTVPGRRAFPQAQKFVEDQRDWINIQLETLPPPQPFVAGGHVLLRGELHTLEWPGPKGRPKVDVTGRRLLIPGPEDSFSGRARRLMIREAREELEAATHFYADKLGKRIGKISVRDTSSRWGSCITRKGEGHISYSWRLISAPPFVLDYVCAHECAHMVEDNHSRAFWDVCASINDDVKKAKRWLKMNGAFLHAVGADY